jgi:hypothetical protein
MRKLTLVSPLLYVEEGGLDPFSPPGEGEYLFCFETGAGGIDVEDERFLGAPLFAARAGKAGQGEKSRELPAGVYLFVQPGEIPRREGIIHLAAELHREGLWQRFSMERRLFLRYLSEDHRRLIQFFRPLPGKSCRYAAGN